jgi:hypothetical protein
MTPDLFDTTRGRPAAPAIGMTVKLDRNIDREHPCCENIAIIHPGKAQHAGELRCATCGSHRGWAPQKMITFIETVSRRFGAPPEPLIWRQEDSDMTKSFDNTNSGALFRDENKTKETDRDYSGHLNVDGVEYWVSGWVKTSKAGKKFLSLSVKPKEARATAKVQALDDEIRF